MKSIYEQILELKNTNYYDLMAENQKINEILSGEESANRYIFEYFKSGSKEEVVTEWINDISASLKKRNLHAVNVYFISLVLCEQMRIQDEMRLVSENDILYTFKYLLYLACLAHDMGYMYEEESNKYKDRPFDGFRENFYLRNAIPVTYLTPDVEDEKLEEKYGATKNLNFEIKFKNGLSVSKSWYSQNVKTNYFKYRLSGMNKLDHGIVGADLLFSKLVKNYKRKFEENKETKEEIDFDKFENSGRIFCSEQFRIFAYIADCVAAHNVYMADEDKRQEYINYGLQPLLPENFKKISFEKNPLLFLLCLADTLEPYKRFESVNENIEILKNISFEVKQREKLIVDVEVGDEGVNFKGKNKEKYINDIKELSKWCDICVNVN